MTFQQTIFIYSLYANAIALILLLHRKTRWPAFAAILLGLGYNLFYVYLRFRQALPMLPMHLGLPALPGCLGLIQALSFSRRKSMYFRVEELLLQLTIVVLCLMTALLPKDFYIPFIRSISIWSHLFLLLGILGRALLLITALKSAIILYLNITQRPGRNQILKTALTWARWGFTFLTLSMFSGEMWCYLGWGTPIIWHDPAITTIMALWIYWVGVLHLHYMKSGLSRWRAQFMLIGGLLILTLACHPDLGPLHWPL